MIPQVGTYDSDSGNFYRSFSASDATSAIVTNELNGEFTLVMEVPVGSEHWKDFRIGQNVLARVSNVNDSGTYGKAKHYFTISDIQMAESGTIQITAEHISYCYKSLLITPFRSVSVSPTDSYQRAWDNLSGAPSGVTPLCQRTNIDTSGINITVQTPTPYRDFIANELLANYGGEMYWSNLRPIWCNRIKDNIWLGQHPTHRAIYGRNIISASVQVSQARAPRWCYPFWGVKDNAVDSYQELSEKKISVRTTGIGEVAVDFSSQFTARPTNTQLKNAAQTYIDANWRSDKDGKAFTLKLSDTDNKAPLVVGDDIYINLQEIFGMSGYYEIIKMRFDVLNEKVIDICCGDQTDNIYAAVKATK